MSDQTNPKNSQRERSLRQLLQDYPDSSQRVIGAGTVHLDPEEIRQSANYKEFVAKVKQYFGPAD